METAEHWARLAMFQILEVQESPAFNGRLSILTLRGSLPQPSRSSLESINRHHRSTTDHAGVELTFLDHASDHLTAATTERPVSVRSSVNRSANSGWRSLRVFG
jgi:hypothetical protein